MSMCCGYLTIAIPIGIESSPARADCKGPDLVLLQRDAFPGAEAGAQYVTAW
jgi:hypothetical protein